MSELLTANIINIIIFGVLYITFILTPKLTRKDLIFGVFIPLDRAKDKEIKRITKQYAIELTVFTLIALAAYFFLLNAINMLPGVFIISIFAFMIGYFLIFLRANHKVKKYKSDNNLMENKKQMVYVNTTMSKKLRSDAVLSFYWFLIPLGIALLNLIIPLTKYDELPTKIAIHWGIDGTANNFVEKSVGAVVTQGLVMMGVVILLIFTNYSIAISKNRIDAAKPIASSQKLFKFKKINSLFIFSIAIIVSTLITLLNFNSLNIISVNFKLLTPILIIVFLVIIIIPIALDIRYGQGGSNLKDTTEEKSEDDVTNIDDDAYWKLGSIYYNPNDPSIFVEKRFGVGWTLNFGNKIAIIISVVLLIFIISILLFPMIFS
ncbi:DUF1648 domain-containing protein [Clostridium sp. 'White wine YQ']|uniref:DUF1648 domain-containing protein n=1 Tax=Clostridium sp. 'White wine YQ' TaxID=3027474 RepID=UPI002365FDCD|nr:DUF5808 domain-containing protein [Clostridium sp. 'White wine YQ']MDD7794183.1 DUF5808 domain-containing protein [Clostridium sp. 'White wine YQ']